MCLCVCVMHKCVCVCLCVYVYVHTSVVASFLLGWASVTSITSVSQPHTLTTTDTNHRRRTGRCVCIYVCLSVCVVPDFNDERKSRDTTVPPKSRPMTPCQQTHARKHTQIYMSYIIYKFPKVMYRNVQVKGIIKILIWSLIMLSLHFFFCLFNWW